jgi:palmitoyl-protein thioesterase
MPPGHKIVGRKYMKWVLILSILLREGNLWDGIPAHTNVFRRIYRTIPESFLQNFCRKNDAQALPVVVLPGANDWCPGVDYFTHSLQKFVNGPVICLEYGPKSDGVFTNMPLLTNIICRKLEEVSGALGRGFTLIGLSMGGLLARAAVQICPMGSRVRTLITLGTPHMGVAKIPSHNVEEPFINKILNILYRNMVYSNLIQRFVSPTNFFKIKEKPFEAVEANIFLSQLNNESVYNDGYRDRMIGLDALVMVSYSEERYLYPKETVLWGYFEDEEPHRLLHFTETRLYRQDAIGTQTLHKAGRLKFIEAEGRHVNPWFVFANKFRELVYHCY